MQSIRQASKRASNPSTKQSIIPSSKQSSNQSIKRASKQASNQSGRQSSNQANRQAINQGITFDENGIKERETEHKSGVEEGIYSLWYENGQKGMECKEVDARGVNCKYWKRDGNTVKEEELSDSEENELFLEYYRRARN